MDQTFRDRAGDQFVDFILKLKENELRRYEDALRARNLEHTDEVTEWEQREYFRIFLAAAACRWTR